MEREDDTSSSDIESTGWQDDVSEQVSNGEDTEDASEAEDPKVKYEFTEMKEQMYQQKLAMLKRQLQQLEEGTLPEYVKKLRKIDQAYEERLELTELAREMEMDQIEAEYRNEMDRAQTEYDDGVFQLRVNLLHEWEEKKKNLELEKQSLELLSDTVEIKPIATRKLRRRPNDPVPQSSDKRKKITPGQVNTLLDEKQIAEDLKLLNKLSGNYKTKPHQYSQLTGNAGFSDHGHLFDARIDEGKLYYDKKCFQRAQNVFVETKEGGRVPGIITAISNQDVWVKKQTDPNKMRINIIHLQKVRSPSGENLPKIYMESAELGTNNTAKGWSTVPKTPSCSFKDVMSEELALELEKTNIGNVTKKSEEDFVWFDPENNDTSSDELLAKLLQKQFDDEQNDIISRMDDKYNGQSKITISHDKYKVKVEELEDSSNEFEDFPLWHDKDKVERTPQFNKSGVQGKGTNMITKHDADLCATKNAAKMDHFPPGMGIGDRTGVKLPNHVFNSLKVHSMTENKKAHRLHEKKEHSTAEMAVDEKTRLILFKLVNGGWLEELRGLVSTGKESVVLHAIGGKNQEILIPHNCAVKVFKTTLSDFKNRAIYVKGDIRFFKDEFKKQNPRKILKIWADKEAANLKRLASNNIPCPSFVVLKKHVLVMSFIGSGEGVPAPTLKEAKLADADAEMAWDQVQRYIKIMYRNCQIVHADLSSYNLLWKDKTVYVIDVGQAVEIQHPLAHQFLLRDCQNVVKFFKDLGVDDLPSPYELFNEVTELELKGEGKEFLQQIQEYEKNEENLRLGVSDKNFAFDFFFDKATKENKK